MKNRLFIICISITFILTGCGQRESTDSKASQRYTVHPINDHYVIIVDQHVGKFMKVGFSNSRWNETPTELKIDWNDKGNDEDHLNKQCPACMGKGEIPCPACKYKSNSTVCPRCSSTEPEGIIPCDICEGTGAVEIKH